MQKDRTPALTAQHLSKRYGKTRALSDFSYTFTPGIYGLLGPNGAGKSTLMSLISSTLRPTGGRVQYGGRDVLALGAAYRAVLGVVPQQMPLYDFFTGQEYLEYIAALKGMARRPAAEAARRALESVELTDQGGARVGGYSGGMKQRLLLAQALLNDPAVLILDEPTAGLDPRQRIVLRNLITRISENKIVIFATHVVPDIEPIAREVLLLRRGRLIDAGPVARLCRAIAGCVAEEELDPDAFAAVAATGRVVNFQPLGARYRVRYLLQAPDPGHPGAAAPTLEDVYLYHFHDSEKSGAAL
ncbi:ATP-binding cassette domain-containing protein [uncultured Subdoligranulum sp.]|uniref:ATP-binding cassette domain-containing protein n=1 Tax=uncultured Subdoligranulum sp. TaxID=512298 RepID=UPI0025E67FBA|nr:ATP-binding cassette domain-containing protein [uncultured Subdoligranulum sp.]